MATRAVQFVSITPIGPANPRGLEPTPNVTDWEYIKEGLEGVPDLDHVDALLTGAHVIHGSYRGWTMYLYPNVYFYRNDPQTRGGHGMAGWPDNGIKEEVTLYVDDEKYAAQIEFV